MIPAVLPPSSTFAGILTCDGCHAFIVAGEPYVIEPDLAGVAPAAVSCTGCFELVGRRPMCDDCGDEIGVDDTAYCSGCAAVSLDDDDDDEEAVPSGTAAP